MAHQLPATSVGTPYWNSTLQCDVDSSDSSSTLIGVIMGLSASVGINSGQNIQAIGLSASEAVRARPYTSRTWLIGLVVFLTGSFLNFAAFSFAASSILVPLEAVQFVTNVCFNKCVNKKPIPLRMLVGVALAVSGVALSVVFGSTDVRCFTIDELIDFWAVPLWWIYLLLTLVIAAAAYAVHRRYLAAQKAGRPLARSQYVLPVTFAVSSALVGGANMIVHSKAVAELFELQAGGELIFASWYFYLEFSLLSVTGCIWLYKMNESLGLYDPLFIIPLLQSSYILFGVISGGIYFQEFAGLHNGPAGWVGWPLFILGMLMILYGLYLIAPDQKTERTGPPRAGPSEEKLEPIGASPMDTTEHEISMEVVMENPLEEDPAAAPQPTAVRLATVQTSGAHTRSLSFPPMLPSHALARLQHASPTMVSITITQSFPEGCRTSPQQTQQRSPQVKYDSPVEFDGSGSHRNAASVEASIASSPWDGELEERV
ncbi:hypothetical protein AB1Y20_015844 [Prymnesium parvum]|uniref:Magnesium transporter n=1 Tax=Prymnesium parvum TaxID=97485 RepID=A0AB34JZM1_PRYPA